MHTFVKHGFRIHHNGDFSGDAEIVDEMSARAKRITVPCSVLLEFAAEFVRHKKIAELEQMDAAQLLGVDKLTL